METEKHTSQDDVIKEEEETERYTRRNDYCEKLQSLVLLGVVIGYCIYGIYKVVSSYDNPSTKYSTKGIEKYDTPWFISCMNGTGINETGNGGDYYLGVSSIYANGTFACGENYGFNSCDMFEPVGLTNKSQIAVNSKPKYTNWTIYDALIYDFTSEEELYCLLVIPPSDIKIKSTKKEGGVVEFEYDVYKQGMFEADVTFNVSAPTPGFLVKQYQFALEHQLFHPDQFYKVASEDYFISDGEEIGIEFFMAIAYETGNDDFYAPACSRTDLQIELYTTKYYSGKKENEYSAASFGSTTDTTMYDSDAVLCQVGLYYYPKIKSKDKKKKKVFFQQNWAEEYLEYDIASLFSGVGGIMGIVEAVLGMFMPFILLGLSVSWLRINFGGYAPYPRFDDRFEFKLSRWLRSYLRQHRDSVQNIIKT